MSKLMEQNGWELMTTMAEIAEPIGNIASDDAVWDVFVECTRRGVGLKQKDGLRFILKTYGKLMPLLFGDDHKRDMVRILAAVEGKPVSEVLQMDGRQLLKSFTEAFKEQLMPFFANSALSDMIG